MANTTVQPARTTQIRNEAIFAQAWTNVDRKPVNASQTPILLYVEVRRGLSPVLDDNITALVLPPKGQQRIQRSQTLSCSAVRQGNHAF